MLESARSANARGEVWMGMDMQKALFLMLMLGFLVKLPAVPFHTWLPDAHVQAPTGGSMLLAGVMLKMGAYGMMRLPVAMFPDALLFYQDLVMFIGLVSLVWGAVVCLGQTNLKRMVVFFSITHGGNPLGYRKHATHRICCRFVHDDSLMASSPQCCSQYACCQASLSFNGNRFNAWDGKSGVHLWQST